MDDKVLRMRSRGKGGPGVLGWRGQQPMERLRNAAALKRLLAFIQGIAFALTCAAAGLALGLWIGKLAEAGCAL